MAIRHIYYFVRSPGKGWVIFFDTNSYEYELTPKLGDAKMFEPKDYLQLCNYFVEVKHFELHTVQIRAWNPPSAKRYTKPRKRKE